MKNRTTILRVGIVTVLSLGLIAPLRSFAVTPTTTYTFPSTKDVIMTELQTASTAGSGEEFVELYNNTDSDIDLSDAAHAGKDAWKLQYFSKSKLPALLAASTSAGGWASPFRTINLTGTIAAHDYYVLAGDTYVPGNIDPDQTYSSTLADDGGALQLIDTTTTGSITIVTPHDRLAWSNDATLMPNSLLFPAPGVGVSLQRLPNDNTEYVNADGSLTGFTADARISPKNAWTAPIEPLPADPVDSSDGDGGTTTVPGDDDTEPTPAPTVPNNDGLLAPRITELLPNPASPQTDEIDEYIELYNPNDAAFNLNGYALETGETTLHDFTFTTDTLLQPHAYRAFYAAETNLALSNSGGQARLLDTKGTVLSQTDAYTTAADGMAWALDEENDSWHWTTALTPGATNLIVTPAVATKATKTAAAPKAKATTAKVKGASTTKTKKVKATATKKSKTTKASTASTLASTTAVRPAAPIHGAVLAAVAILAVGYGVYEYRHDLANRIYQFRSNRAIRRKARG